MSFYYTIDKSATTSICKIVRRPLLTSLYTATSTSDQRYYVRATSLRRFLGQLDSHSELNAWFVSALVNAGKCKEHTSKQSSLHSSQGIQRLGIQHRVSYSFTRRRPIHTAVQTVTRPTTREELLALVDQYDIDSYSADHAPLQEPSSPERLVTGPRFGVSDETGDYNWPSRRFQWPPRCKEERRAIETLQAALEDNGSDPQDLYRFYRALPAPRVPYLTAATRHKLLYRLGVLERKDEPAMLRYMSVIDDMQATGIPLTVYEWNCATSFAGRYVVRTTEVEVEAALRLWREMEHVSGIRANSATFNILFDTATKAGKFELAEMMYREMERRGYTFNRFHHVSLIHHYGLRGDGEGVRKAYKALVEAGEIVDTVVLNCTISSLIRAYEPEAAQQVYERMKKFHEEGRTISLPPRDYRRKREVTRALMRMSKLGRTDPTKLATFQRNTSIAPDIQTYRILIQYLSAHYGDLQKVASLLDEMRWYKVPLHGSIFLSLLKGFAIHGGILYSHWTSERLESVWKAYLHAVDQQVEGVYIGKWMVCWALKAFSKCFGKARTIEVWEEIKEKWKPENDDLIVVTNVLRSLIEGQ
jgi:pentatricopeptide repeat protein